MTDNIYTYLENNFNIKVTDYKFKRDYIKNPLRKGVGSPKPIRKEYPDKEDLEYLYLTLNLKRDYILKIFNCSCTSFKRFCSHLEVRKPVELLEINAKKYEKEKFNGLFYTQTDEFKKLQKEHREEWKEKVYKGMKKSGNFGKSISLEEKSILNKLLTKFPNIKIQHKTDKYPFKCDFYIPEIDTYIEYNGYWKHGTIFKFNGVIYDCHEPYDANNPIHKELVSFWKSKNTKFYDSAVYIWTVNDPLKRKTAKDNGLNYLEFFNMNEFNKWFEEIDKKNIDKTQ